MITSRVLIFEAPLCSLLQTVVSIVFYLSLLSLINGLPLPDNCQEMTVKPNQVQAHKAGVRTQPAFCQRGRCSMAVGVGRVSDEKPTLLTQWEQPEAY